MRRKVMKSKITQISASLLSALLLINLSVPTTLAATTTSFDSGVILAQANTENDYSTGTVVTHTVKAGEYLYKIARDYGVTVNELRLWNHLTSDVLQIGQKLKIIPYTVTPPPSGTIHTVRIGDTLWGIANLYRVTVAQLKQWNNLTSDWIYIGQRLNVTSQTTPPPITGETYTVRSGDTLWSIAQRTGVSVAQLKQWNGLTSDFLRIGQVLRLKAPTTPPPVTGDTYTVRSGDTLWSIAQRAGVTVAQLRQWNGLTSDYLRIGQVLRLKAPTTPPPITGETYTVRSGDTLWSIAQRTGLTVAQLRQWNNLTSDALFIGQVLKLKAPPAPTPIPPGEDGFTYTVKSGDTLYSIANRYGVTVALLMQWNNLTSDSLYIGQKLSVVETTTPPPVQGHIHTVQAGDTLWNIAFRYSVSVEQLKLWNNLTTDILTIGQFIKVTAP